MKSVLVLLPGVLLDGCGEPPPGKTTSLRRPCGLLTVN